ncbi:helix-turn-helix domain-containing protein [Pseudonocardia kujensis]|uniref:ArsR/SmtB family transcription factor n=1 Tax=Pseudonocardia kujensis TaxID=1128675 RepID=UPI001E5BC5BC|nr:helix-turn-helix domain-containing protein [Pseudonocardia kujensis]MCE0762926.1 helix-turn-helix domain-containing protein [Pseudonocardia kujensis]
MVVRERPVHGLSPDEVDRIFHGLADATRRDIVERVLHEAQSVSTLARRYDMSFAAVQKHVAVLERAALVTKQRRGREQLVHGNPEALQRAARLLDDYERIWRHRVRAIEDVLAEDALAGDPEERTEP